MAKIQQGDYLKVTPSIADTSNALDVVGAFNNTLNITYDAAQKANASKIANNAIDLSNRALALNNEINIKYQADPTNPEREREFREGFELLAGGYKVNPLIEGQWAITKDKIYNNYSTYNAKWQIKQQQENATNDLKNGYEALNEQISMLGKNGANYDEVRLVYENGISGLRNAAITSLGEIVTENFLKDANHDFMTSYIGSLAMDNPLKAQALMKDDGVLNDIGNAQTIEKLNDYINSSMLNQHKKSAVAELGNALRAMRSDEANELISRRADLSKAMRFVEGNKNLPEGSKDLVLGIYGIGSKTDYYYDRDSEKIVKKDEAGSGSSNRLTALKKMSKSDKEDLAVDLESQLYDLFSFEETKKVNPKKAVKKGQANQLQSDVLSRMEMVAEAQGQIDQAWNAGVITKAKRQELMSKFIQPMTEYLENNLEELDEHQGFIGSKLGYDKLKKAFSTDDIPENHTAKIRAKKQEMLIAQGAYYSMLDAKRKELDLGSIYELENQDRNIQQEIYKNASEEAIKYAQKYSSHPEQYFKVQYPQLYNQGIALFGTKDGDMVARRVATKIYNAPEDEKIDVKKEYGDAITEMYAIKKDKAMMTKIKMYEKYHTMKAPQPKYAPHVGISNRDEYFADLEKYNKYQQERMNKLGVTETDVAETAQKHKLTKSQVLSMLEMQRHKEKTGKDFSTVDYE